MLTLFDDKRFHLSDGITTLPLGCQHISDYYIKEYPEYEKELIDYINQK